MGSTVEFRIARRPEREVTVEPNPVSLESLLRRCRDENDKAAWNVLFTQFNRLIVKTIHKTIIRKGFSGILCEDVVNEIYRLIVEKAVQKRLLKGLEHPLALPSWIRTSVERMTLTWLRKQNTRKTVFTKYEENLMRSMDESLSVDEAITLGETVGSDETERMYREREVHQRLDDVLADIEKMNEVQKQLDWGTIYAKAASTSSSGVVGVARGITVDTDPQNPGERPKGSLVDCVAWVSQQEYEEGSVEINAQQIMGFGGDGLEYQIVPPFRFLEKKLDALMDNPLLRPFKLNRRRIIVEIEPLDRLGFFKKSHSLALSAFMAILSAVTGREINRSIAFSAQVRMNGLLEPAVANVDIKLEAAVTCGEVKELILSGVNQPDCPKQYLNGDGAVSVRFFAHMGQVMEYFGLVPTPLPAENNENPMLADSRLPPVNDIQLAPDPSEVLTEFFKLGASKGIHNEAMRRILEAVEDLSQMQCENKPLSTALIIGRPGPVVGLFPECEIRLNLRADIFEVREYLRLLADIVNGETACFFFDNEAAFHSVRKTNIALHGNPPKSGLLKGENGRYCTISAVSQCLLFYLTPGGNRVHVFSDGQMPFKYMKGDWQRCELDEFEKQLLSMARNKQYDISTVVRIAQIALRMSNRNLEALLVVFGSRKDIEGQYEDCLKRFGVEMETTSLPTLSDEALINLAQKDGAVLINSKGRIQTFMAVLTPKLKESHHRFDPRNGLRRLSAQRFTRNARCLAVVVSEDGTVALFCDGEKICQM